MIQSVPMRMTGCVHMPTISVKSEAWHEMHVSYRQRVHAMPTKSERRPGHQAEEAGDAELLSILVLR